VELKRTASVLRGGSFGTAKQRAWCLKIGPSKRAKVGSNVLTAEAKAGQCTMCSNRSASAARQKMHSPTDPDILADVVHPLSTSRRASNTTLAGNEAKASQKLLRVVATVSSEKSGSHRRNRRRRSAGHGPDRDLRKAEVRAAWNVCCGRSSSWRGIE
jgi:hypothetical protein